MNECALLHIMDSAYCFPTSEHDITIRLRCAKGDLREVYICYENKYVIADKQIKKPMVKTMESKIFDYYSISLHIEDPRIAYVFYLYDGEAYKYYSEEGLTDTYDYSIGFYNFFQYAYINKSDVISRVSWMNKARFYQIFVDRFNMGSDDKDKSYINLKWGDIPSSKSFAGGDLKGIRKKLDYIASLGVNALYLTPIFSSVSNHKYDIIDYYRIDEQFGTSQDLKDLVKACHEKGMKLVLDAVFNHCSNEMAQFKDVCEKGRKSPYYDWFIIKGDKPNPGRLNYEVFAHCEYMPKLNTSNPEVADFLVGVATHYINEYDIDGWRLDVSDEVSHDFWRKFRIAVKSAKSDAVIIGENWHDASSYLRGDQYDSIMNYGFTKCCLDYFARKTIHSEEMAYRLNELLCRNNDVVNDMMLNLFDSHDTHRFFSEVKENKDAFINALCLLYLFPGAPCIFYGTELMMKGGYDPDCRRCMDWDKAGKIYSSELYKILTLLSDIRDKYALRSSNVRIYDDDGLLVVRYRNEKEDITLALNNTSKAVDGALGTVKAGGRLIDINGRKIL